jgi:hypothetical protein
MCHGVHYVEVEKDAYEAWQDGMLIQNAMPNLDPTEREQLISGLCPMCQDEVFN